jgi:ABC-type antimicrobial peptide transport system permease subunit
MALGANRSAVVGLVMRQGLGIAAVGVAIGTLLSLGAAKAVAGALRRQLRRSGRGSPRRRR